MNYDKYLYYIWLNNIKGVGPGISRKLLDKFIVPENIYNASIDELKEIDGIGEETAKRIFTLKNLDRAKKILHECCHKNINITVYNEEIFPQSINKFKNMPTLLYYRGRLHTNTCGVAIVGARRCTDYGKRVTAEAAKFLAENNISVISGMAKGIDSYAHTACLKSGGYTIAFLGCSVDVCYPIEHIELMQRIIENGAVISEYSPGTKPKPEYFPKRNRLISAAAEKVLVVEAGENSGALITAKYAKDMKKEVFAVPNSIYMKESRGSNKLIYEGANIYLDPHQLLVDNFKCNSISKAKFKNNEGNLNNIERYILSVIKNNPRTIDEIIMLTKKDRNVILEILFSMELEEKIKSVGGGRYFAK
jgi:DNA processing protein